MQSRCRNTKLLQHRGTGPNGICPGQGNDEGPSSDGERKAQNGMLTGCETFTLRTRHSSEAVTSDWQSPVVRDPAR